MADIRRGLGLRHFRGEPTFHTIRYVGGEVVGAGRGQAFWFRPRTTGIAEVPLDDRETTFLFQGRTADFQEATVQGVVTYRVVEPVTLADRIDFTIDLDTGAYTKTPLENLAGLLTQLAQEFTLSWIAQTELREVLAGGLEELRRRIQEGLSADDRLSDMGIAVVAVRVSSVRPPAELERALQTPTLETLQQSADEATFERRAIAVENERAITQNELQSQIELAEREERLIGQRGANERRRVEDEAGNKLVESQAMAERSRVKAAADAERIRAVEAANAEAEEASMAIVRDLPVEVLLGLAARELAGKLERIDHLSVAPDMLGPVLNRLVSAGTHALEGGGDQ